jgi:hypothetical protein
MGLHARFVVLLRWKAVKDETTYPFERCAPYVHTSPS